MASDSGSEGKVLIDETSRLSLAEPVTRSLASSDRAFSSPVCHKGMRAFFAKEGPGGPPGP